MDQTIRQIYTKLYDSYPTSPGDVDWVRGTISDVTSAFTGEKKVPLREDAKYFILVNFAEMIARPLREKVAHDRLAHDLKHDLKLLLDSASFIRKEKEESSGHDIANALSKNWGELEVMKLDLWG
jgi:hypothetical protein